MTADAAFWDDIAETYAAKPVDDPAMFTRKIQNTTALMHPGCQVLDVGCATGSLSLRLAAHAGQIHGLDISEEMVRIARHKVREAGQEHLHFHVGTLADVPLEAGSLDGVCSYSVLHLVPDRADFLRRVYALLKPGGFFVSSTVVLAEEWVPYGLILPVMKWLGKAPEVAVISKETVLEEARAAGFEALVEPIPDLKSSTLFLTCRKPAQGSGQRL